MSVNKRTHADTLRERAEALLARSPEDVHPSDLQSVIQLARDLAAHQNELEHQREHFAVLYEHAPVGYVVLDASGIIRQTNATMLALLNRNEEDLRGKSITEVMIPEDVPDFLARFQPFFRNPEGKQIIVRMMRKDSTPFYAQIEASLESGQRLEEADEAGSNQMLMVVITDISELQLANERIEHVNRVLLGIRNVNQLIVSEDDPFLLIENACNNLTETMGYFGAWCVLLDSKSDNVMASTASGFDNGFEKLRERIGRGEYPDCMKISLENAGLHVVEDPSMQCPECVLSPEYSGRAGFCRRLSFEGKIYGILAVSVPRAYAGNEEEQELFTEVAGDLAFALHKIEMERLRRREHERLEFVITASRLGTWEWNVQTGETVFNDTWATMAGYTLEELAPCTIETWEQLTHPDDLARARERLASCIAGETPEYQCELRMKHKGGHWIRALDSGRIMTYDDDGKPLSMFGTHADITGLKQTENELRLTSESLQAILDHSPLLMSEISLDGAYLRVNAATAELFGQSPASLAGISFGELLPADTVKVFMERTARVAETRESLSVEDHLNEGGEERHYLTTLYPLFDSSGNVRSIGAIAHDITGRVRAEEKVRRQAERLQALVDILQYQPETVQDFLDHALDKAITLTDSKIGYIYFYDEESRRFELNSWSKDVMKECSVAGPPTTYELDSTGVWGEAVRQGRPILLNDYQCEHPLKKGVPEGHVFLTKFLTVPVFHNERIVAVVGVANKTSDYDETDVLELTLLMDAVWKAVETMRGEQALRDREEHISLLGSMLDAAPASITIHDIEGRFVYANRATLVLHGYDSLEEFLSVNLHELDVPESEALLAERMRDIAEEGEARFEVNHYRKDGSTFPLEITAKSIDWQGSPAVLSIASDITSRKMAEDALVHARDLLRYIIEHANSGVAVHDKQLRYIYVSKPYLDMYNLN